MTPVSESAESRKYRLRWWTLSILSLSLLIIIIDDTIVNVAIPTIQRELAASASDLQWIIGAYILVFAGLLLAMGSLSDRFGRKRVMQIGLVVFGVASTFAAFIQTSGALIAARAVMGLGAAMIMPSTLAIIMDVFPRGERARAIGIWTATAGVGIPLGPLLGGLLLQFHWFGSIFLINLPIVLIVLVAGLFLVPESRKPTPPRMDILGMVTSFGALVLLVYAIIEAGESGIWQHRTWADPLVHGAFVAGLILAAAFVVHERRTDHPMLDVGLFKNPRFSSGALTLAITFVTFTGLFFVFVQYLQLVRGYTPFETALLLLPLILAFVIASGSSPRVVAKLGTRLTITMGLGIVATSMAALSLVDGDTSILAIAIVFAAIGFGMGNAMVPSTAAIMAAVPEGDAGVGSAVNDVARQVGAVIGIAVMGSVLNSAYSSGMASAVTALPADLAAAAQNFIGAALQIASNLGGLAGEALRIAAIAAFVDGLSMTMLAAATIATVGAVLAFLFMPARDLDAG